MNDLTNTSLISVCLAEDEAAATTTEAPEDTGGGTNAASDSEYISCYTCGDDLIDPTQESQTYCDKTKVIYLTSM